MAIEVNPDEDFHVVLNGNVVALSLNALDAAYQADTIDDSTLIWQEGFGEWMRLDTVLAELAGEDEPDIPDEAPTAPVQDFAKASPASSASMYSVMVAEGDIKQMSLDLIKDTYRMQVITDETLVWQPGYAEWVPLSVVLGQVQAHVSIAPSTAPQAPAPSTRPTAPLGTMSPASLAPPAPSNRAPAPSNRAPAPSNRAPHTATLTPPAAASALPPPPSVRPSPASAPPSTNLPAPSLPPGSHATFMPSPPSTAPSVAPAPSPSFAPPSVRSVPPVFSEVPVALSIPQPPARPSPWFNRALVALAAGMTLFVANRNGVGAELTHDLIHGESAEAAAAGQDTPFGLSLWLDDLNERYHLDALSNTSPVAEEPTEVAVPDEEPEESAPAEESEPSGADQKDAATAQKPGAAAAFGAKLSNKPAPKVAAPRRAPPSSARPQVRKSPPKSSLPTTGDSFDPMNGAL